MGMKMRWGLSVATLLLFVGSAVASDTAGLKAELADLKAKVASMESAQMSPCAPSESGCESLVSLRKKANIKIGGGAEVAVILIDREDTTDDNDNVMSTSFTTTDAHLTLRAYANQDVYLNVKLDLDDAWDEDVDQDDLLEECYFMWKHVRGSNFGIKFGKAEVPFGQDYDKLILDAYVHGSSSSVLGKAWEADVPASENGAGENPHDAIGSFSHPAEEDNSFLAQVNYSWKDLADFEFAVFQNNDTTGGGRKTRGMHEDRSDDHLGFQSVAGRVTFMPVEGLEIELSAMNRHIDSYEDVAGREDDQMAVSLGANYTFSTIPVTLFGEYIRGWDWSYTDDYDSNVGQLGVKWGVTEAIDLFLVGEGVWNEVGSNDHDYIKMSLAGQYTFDNGIALSMEYHHEWYDYDGAGADMDRDSDVLVFGTKWKF